MELISKDDVIKALQKWNCREYASLTIHPYEVLRDIPTIEERKWIPVSKRLPKEEKKTYLITTDNGYMCSCRWTDDVCGFGIHSEWGWHRIDKPQYSKVVAWMDIEPYKGE